MIKMKADIYRIIDANLNRSREGLRVCEDIARFALGSKTITAALKAVRHSISAIVKNQAALFAALPASRDSDSDVLRCSGTASEMKRRNLADIFAANIERVKESVRVLEELFKLIDKKCSSKFCGIRFKIYAIEKKTMKKLYDAD